MIPSLRGKPHAFLRRSLCNINNQDPVGMATWLHKWARIHSLEEHPRSPIHLQLTNSLTLWDPCSFHVMMPKLVSHLRRSCLCPLCWIGPRQDEGYAVARIREMEKVKAFVAIRVSDCIFCVLLGSYISSILECKRPWLPYETTQNP